MSKKGKLERIKLIANQNAGKGSQALQELEEANTCLQDLGFDVDIGLSGSKKAAKPIIKKAVKDGYRTLVAMGGDGTIETLMRVLLHMKKKHRKRVRLGILPCGTANNIARSLGIPADLQAACALIAQGQVQKLDVGVASTKQRKNFYFFEIVAVGLTAALYPAAEDIQKGKLTAVREVVDKLAEPVACASVTLKMDGKKKITLETLLATVSNTPVFGMNFLVAPDASLNDARFNLSLYPDFNKVALLAYYARVRDEGETQDGRVERYLARQIKIQTTPALDIMADGEMLGKGEVRIRMRPGALQVIAPRAGDNRR